MEIKEIKVGLLSIDKYNVRKGEWVHDQELVESIKQQGVIEPLIVRSPKHKSGKEKLFHSGSIICGSRRWNAAISAGLKTVPCVVRDINDMTAFGLSLQENLARKSLDRSQEAEAVAKMWGMLNGGRKYEEKMEVMNKQFALSKPQVKKYLQISTLSESFRERFLKGSSKSPEKLDIDTSASLASSDWDEQEKEEAGEILSEVASRDKRTKILSEMKKYDDELPPKEAFDKVEKIQRIKWYRWRPTTLKMNKAMDYAAKQWETDYNGVIETCVSSELKRKGWYK